MSQTEENSCSGWQARGAKWNAANKWLLSPRWIENLVCKHKYHLITTISIQIDAKDPGGHTDDKTTKNSQTFPVLQSTSPSPNPSTHQSYNRKGGVTSPKLSDLKFDITSNYQWCAHAALNDYLDDPGEISARKKFPIDNPSLYHLPVKRP